MSIIDRNTTEVQSEWHTLDADCPLDARIVPAEDGPVGFPGDACDLVELLGGSDREPEYLPRFEVRAYQSKYSLHQWAIYDRMLERNVGWYDHRQDALDDAADMIAEDFAATLDQDGETWWATLPTEPELDDVRWTLTETEAPICPSAWLAEGQARLKATGSTRGDLFGHDQADASE